MYLNYDEYDEIDFGINKHPISAGQGSGNLKWDIVKGSPEESILAYRMKHTDPNIMMPEMGKKLIDEEEVALIEQLIEHGCRRLSELTRIFFDFFWIFFQKSIYKLA